MPLSEIRRTADTADNCRELFSAHRRFEDCQRLAVIWSRITQDRYRLFSYRLPRRHSSVTNAGNRGPKIANAGSTRFV